MAQGAITQYESGSLDLYDFTGLLEDAVSLSEASDDHVAADFRGIWGAIETVNAMQLFDLEKGTEVAGPRIEEDQALVAKSIQEIRALLGLG